MKYIITFPSITACFKADVFMNTMENIEFTKEVSPIPYKLSNTCYGLGLNLETDEIKKIFEEFSKNQIEFKHLWQDVNDDGNYIIIDQKVGETGE